KTGAALALVADHNPASVMAITAASRTLLLVGFISPPAIAAAPQPRRTAGDTTGSGRCVHYLLHLWNEARGIFHAEPGHLRRHAVALGRHEVRRPEQGDADAVGRDRINRQVLFFGERAVDAVEMRRALGRLERAAEAAIDQVVDQAIDRLAARAAPGGGRLHHRHEKALARAHPDHWGERFPLALDLRERDADEK